ncbi:Restriction of telomere capping protein 5 [Arachnomyces sp. PD_36]|nr:Restriction of telomere capping protein 5 [Arachnomyces sp. PD_36]
MGGYQSTENVGVSSPDELSQILAHRFATKCFTPLELTHLKDNFFGRASDQNGLRYWTEETLSHFLGIPDGAGPRVGTTDDKDAPHIDAGPVIFRMVSYLGAFPLQNTLAPSVLTLDALVKVTVLLTERYGKVLKRGGRDRVKLLFGSLADVGRRDVGEKVAEAEGKNGGNNGAANGTTNGSTDQAAAKERTYAAGFSVDEPTNDDDEEDEDDDLALAALESLDAIEVFKHDHRIDRKVYEARISVDTLRRLLMLLILIAPLRPQETVSKYTTGLSRERIESVSSEADSILAGFSAEELSGGISYKSFSRIATRSLPYLFDPLTPLFEHLLFSKNLDLSRKHRSTVLDSTIPTSPAEEKPAPAPVSPPLSPVLLPGSFEGTILTPSLLSHLSFFLPTATSIHNLFRNGSHLHPVFSTSAHGESLTSFEHHVMTWQAPSLLLLQGVSTPKSPTSKTSSSEDGELITMGAYLPHPWKSNSSETSISASDPSSFPYLFQLSPTHSLLPGNPSNKSSTLTASFSSKTGIALGCRFPPRSRSQSSSRAQNPIPIGGGSLIIDNALEHAKFIVSNTIDGGEGAFLPPILPSSSSPSLPAPKTTEITLYSIEVWGLVPAPEEPIEYPSPSQRPPHHRKQSSNPADAIAQQRAHWNFEAREAERRRTINYKVGGESDIQSARALLEMGGIIGDSKRSGGSV